MNKKEDVSNLIFRMALASVSALLLVLAFPGFNLSFLAWIGMVPLFFALEGKKAGEAFLIAYTAGIVFFLGTVWWLIHVTLPGMIVLVLYLGLFFGGFGAIASLGLSPSKNISNRAHLLHHSRTLCCFLSHCRNHPAVRVRHPAKGLHLHGRLLHHHFFNERRGQLLEGD